MSRELFEKLTKWSTSKDLRRLNEDYGPVGQLSQEDYGPTNWQRFYEAFRQGGI